MKTDLKNLIKDRIAVIIFVLFLAFSLWLNYHTFSRHGGDINVAGGAWSDIVYHHAYVRTISLGQNIPVQYPYYANAPIKYHFMFNYYAGKLTLNGLDSVHSLNLISSLSLAMLLLLIFEFGRMYFKNALVGILGSLFLIFHSSYSAFVWLLENRGRDIIQKVISRQGWLQNAMFESWGLFNLNVFINRRNFAFALAILVLLAIYLSSANTYASFKKSSLLNKKSLFTAVVLGILPFWNVVAAAIGVVMIGAFAIINFRNKKVFFHMLFIAIMASLLIVPQALLFKSGESVLSTYPKIHIGYAADNNSIFSIPVYYFKVLGFKAFAIVFSFIIVDKQKKLGFLVFSIPFVLANTLQFGKILYDNNQLLFIWLVFMNCYTAYAIVWLFEKLHKSFKFLPMVLTLSMLIAGVLDLFSVINMPKSKLSDQSSELVSWITENTSPDAVFLTDFFIPFGDNSMVGINLAGRKLYCVRNDVDSSCDVDKRYEVMKSIFSAQADLESINSIMLHEGIDFILIDNLVRANKDFNIYESFFETNFELVYLKGDISVYQIKN